jgi:UDP-GlcNAc:undecaprenyl-phosphate/decaprenyl-phosphate GlcNAc-1-phosphate transferase
LENSALGFFTAFFIVLLLTQALIKIIRTFAPQDFTLDKAQDQVPVLGGILIGGAVLFSYSMWFPSNTPEDLKFVLAAGLMLLFWGLKEDVHKPSGEKRFFALLLAAFILIMPGDIRVHNLFGFLGIREMPLWGSVFFSVFLFMIINHAINAIDDMEGLTSICGIVSSLAFFIWFFMAGDLSMSLLALSLSGALMAFMFFGSPPAKILPGYSGNLFVGFVLAVLAIRLLDNKPGILPYEFKIVSKSVLAFAILAYPLTDAFRMFILNIVKGLSPFSSERNHLHHRLLEIGLSVKQSLALIALYNAFIIITVFLVRGAGKNLSFILVAGLAIALAQIPFFFTKVKQEAQS